MINPPKSKAEAKKLTYGDNLSKAPFNSQRCAWEVTVDEGRWASFHQCYRKPGFGPDGIFCKLHDPAAIKKRDEKRHEKFKQKMQQERPKWYAREMLALLKESQLILGDDEKWRKQRDRLIKQIESDP